MRVETGARGGAADGQLLQPLHRVAQAVARPGDRLGVGGEFLAETHGDRVLKMGAARLEDPVECAAAGAQRDRQAIGLAGKPGEEPAEGHAHGGGVGIVG
jgi:hypothetical protein